MRAFSRNPLRHVVLALTVLVAIFVAACGSTSSTSAGLGAGTTLNIGTKVDADSQLLGSMYKLLLQKQGYKVNLRLALGEVQPFFNAYKSGQIDIGPEFTGTGINLLQLPVTSDPQTAYNEVKQAYESQLKITWLDASFNLNDDYGICVPKAIAQKYSLTSIADLSSHASTFTIYTQQDAIDSPVVLPALETSYGLSFKKTTPIKEGLSFDAATQDGGDAANVCYTTDAQIVTKNFVLLKDSKNVLPVYNPAPVISDAVLSKHPDIATTLNALASKLNTDNIVKLIKQVSVDSKDPGEVAQQFLKDQGLL